MMERKLSVLIVTFPYSGNGSISSQADETSDWVIDTMLAAARDERIEWCRKIKISDTPITMTRNRAVMAAREMKADVLVMVDSDMWPDKRLQEGDKTAVPFFASSFDYLYRHYDRGPVAIGAPYCGPPPQEVVYVFHWTTEQSQNPNLQARIQKYSREHAAMMSGIQECAALPTGLIMYDMRCFDLTEPKRKRELLHDQLMAPIRQQLADGQPFTEQQMGEIVQRCLDARQNAEQPWFYYEWTDEFKQRKASTEDVTQTRDLAAHGLLQLGYNPLRCNWDAWAGHWKVKCVDKPIVLTVDKVQQKYRDAVLENREACIRTFDLDMMQL